MGTTTAVGTELVLKQVVEILGPSGTYETRRIALKHEYEAIVVASKKLTAIETAEQAEEATQFGRLLQNGKVEIETFFKGIKSQIDSIKAPVLAAEKEDVGPLNTEKSRLGGLLTVYQAEQRRIREEEERKAREAAEAQAQEDALQRALELEAAGEGDAADAVLSEPIVAAPVVIPASAPKPVGSVARKAYKAEVIDFKALVSAVAAGKVPLLALQANEVFIGQQARSMGEAFEGLYPGVKLVITESTSFRS